MPPQVQPGAPWPESGSFQKLLLRSLHIFSSSWINNWYLHKYLSLNDISALWTISSRIDILDGLFNWFWKLIPSHIFLFLDQPQPNRKQEGYRYSTCLNSRWVVLLRSTRNLWKPLYSSIGFECHQFNLNATTPPNKTRFTLLEAWISSWNFASLNINNLSWWDGGHLLVEYQPKNIVLHLVNWQDQDDYWLRAVMTWNFLQWYLCWYYIFLASAEYIDLEINFKSDRVYILTI